MVMSCSWRFVRIIGFFHYGVFRCNRKMSTTFVSETLKLSISQLEGVSDDVFQQVAELNAQSPNFLLTTEIASDEEVAINQKLQVIQSSFDKISGIVTRIKDPSSVKGVKLSEVFKVLEPFKDGSIVAQIKRVSSTRNQEEDKHLQLIAKLENLVVLYSVAALYQVLLTKILKSTLPLNDSYYYYDITCHSNWRTLLYTLQTFPRRVVSLITKVLSEITNARLPDIESSDVQSTQFLSSYPVVADFYKYVRFYTSVITSSVYSNITTNNIKGFYRLSTNAFKFNKVGLNPTKSFFEFKKFAHIIISAPLSSIDEELKSKRQSIESAQSEAAKTLGYLITNIPDYKELNGDTGKTADFLKDLINSNFDQFQMELATNDPFKTLYSFTDTLNGTFHSSSTKSKLQWYLKPSFLTRYWPAITLSILYGPDAIRNIISNRDVILGFIRHKLVDTVIKFYKNWILKPLTDIIATIRHDSNSEISIMSQTSLTSDMDSLKRMVVDYTIDNSPGIAALSPSEMETLKMQLEDMVAKGDLTPVMERYEGDMKNPLLGALRGELIRGLLIQLQKGKVDGTVAISGIDKLLKSQQLVFGMVAAAPSLIIVVYLANFMNRAWNKGFVPPKNAGERRLIVSKSLNNVERLLGELDGEANTDENYRINGLLVLEIFSLRLNGFAIIPRNRRDEWIRDINDLIKSEGKTHVKKKLNTVRRIYHVYGSFF